MVYDTYRRATMMVGLCVWYIPAVSQNKVDDNYRQIVPTTRALGESHHHYYYYYCSIFITSFVSDQLILMYDGSR